MPAAASKSKKTGRKAARDGRGSFSNSKASSTHSQETTDSTPPKDRGPNVIILSSAGKPIFVRHGSDEDEWSSACGLLQGLRANVLSFDDADSSLGEIQSIQAGNMLIVFLNTKALTLVAISDGENGSQNEGWLRLQLEYTYAQVIFTLTDQIQSIFEQSPSYDLRTMMGPNVDASLRNLLDQFDPPDSDEGTDISASSYNSQGASTFLTAGIECVFPLNPELRESTSRLLIDTCRGDDTLFALLVIGTRLVTIVQPSNPSSQLHTSDLHLIMTFVGRQPGLLTNELWFPVCLPRFDSSGFLYAYTSCLDPVHTGLSIVLISGNNSTEQFKVFHSAADTVRSNLGLPPLSTVRSSLSASTSSYASSTRDDRRTTTNWSDPLHDDTDTDSDYDDDSERRGSILSRISASGNGASAGRGIAPRPTLGDRQLSMTNYLTHIPRPNSKSVEEKEKAQDGPFVTALKIALLPKQQEDILNQYLDLASAVHFCFRCDIYVQGSSGTSTEGMLTQCFGPPLSFPFTDAQSQRKVWDIYQRLSLRLRLGSSSVETCYDALDMFQGHDSSMSGSISNDCPMQSLLESPPNVHGVTYLQEDNEWLYVGLNGKFFELYATLPATVKPREGTAYCARLVRKLMGDERILFLSNPLTWNS
uniref:Vacuolar fusion protein MON1 homolog n=1 Tax=Skeletonema marinoi TaxID=267567 RepID=A0A7S2Q3X1_9STRA|mmetsp:Transcript_9173/g.15596  ORF Transcript_9173/g.15596 Transcript_9173/m.15596 type:complete len:647 (+) Transcript_9173:199-2139(+)